jgi:hypothetical protein
MAWQISGQYMETCNCDFLCPCITTGLAESTHGTCIFAMAFRIDEGNFNGTSLNGLKFVLVGRTPEAMAKGNWDVGVIADEQASPEQQDALTQITSGAAGGPVGNLAPMIGNFLGMESRAIHFEGSGNQWTVRVPERVEQALAGVTGLAGGDLFLDNAGHPAANRLGLARAQHSRFHAFGIDFEQEDGKNNGHFAPFRWEG